jgi:hypothetical protein
MPRNPLTQQAVARALRKLEAVDVTPKGCAHPKFAIYHEGQIVARTGLRRSSKADIGVPHVKNDLRVNVHFILELAACPKSREDWLRAIGEIDDENDQTPEPSDSG